MNPAPTDALTSLTATVNPDGAPLSAGFVESERCVCAGAGVVLSVLGPRLFFHSFVPHPIASYIV